MAPKNRTVVIKLGGSVITDKSAAFKANYRSMNAIATELAKVRDRLILLNGAGSFGHIPVKQYGLDKGFSREDKEFCKNKTTIA